MPARYIFRLARKNINAKSIMGMMSLSLAGGDEIHCCDGTVRTRRKPQRESEVSFQVQNKNLLLPGEPGRLKIDRRTEGLCIVYSLLVYPKGTGAAPEGGRSECQEAEE